MPADAQNPAKRGINFGNGVVLNGTDTEAAFFLAKFAPSGLALWAIAATPVSSTTGTDLNYSAKIAVDSMGNVFWGGHNKSLQLDFGNGFLATRTCTNNCVEGFLAKINPSGAVEFVKSLRAADGETFSLDGVGAAPDGRHFVTGRFFGSELWLQGGANIGGITTPGFLYRDVQIQGGK